MSKSKRKTRSDKFPLTLHPTEQYCKKVNGKLYYFGSDKNHALEKYLSQASYLHGNKEQTHKKAGGEMTLKELCDLYLQITNHPKFAVFISESHNIKFDNRQSPMPKHRNSLYKKQIGA